MVPIKLQFAHPTTSVREVAEMVQLQGNLISRQILLNGKLQKIRNVEATTGKNYLLFIWYVRK